MDRSTLELVVNEAREDFLTLPDTYVPRAVNCRQWVHSSEVVVITGVRRCGKSFLMKLLARELQEDHTIAYLDLDDPRLLKFEASDFQSAYELWLKHAADPNRPVAIFLDEPQNVAGWERWVTFFAKQPRQHVFVTGSNSTMLSSDLATHLTGRHRELALTPMSYKEIVEHAMRDSAMTNTTRARAGRESLLDRYFTFGGFPRVFLDQDRPLLAQYYKDIVSKDIAQRKGSGPPREMLELGSILMSNNTRLTNKSRLAQQLGLRQQRTISGRIELFRNAYLVYEIRKFDASLKKQQRSLPKYYAIDPALARAVGFGVFEDQSSTLENMVLLELVRRGYEIFYWTSREGWEVDFIARKQGAGLSAFQVCLDVEDKDVAQRETRALVAAEQQLGIRDLHLIVRHPTRRDVTRQMSITVATFDSWARE